jgi:hypothetical protein
LARDELVATMSSSKEKLDSTSDDGSSGGRSNEDQSSSYETSSGSGGSGQTGSAEDFATIKNGLAKAETKQVFRLRVLVVSLLIAAATSISVTIYYITRTAEIEEFEAQYYGSAEKIIDALQEVLVKMAAVSGLAVAATADTQATRAQGVDAEDDLLWPLFTMTSFQERAANAKAQSGAIYVSINPIVDVGDLSKWERYILSDDANYWM